MALLRGQLAKVARPLDTARDLADRPRGRFTVAWSDDLINTMMPHVQQVRDVTEMLALHALLRALDRGSSRLTPQNGQKLGALRNIENPRRNAIS